MGEAMARIIKANSADSAQPAQQKVLSLGEFASEARAIVLEARQEAARITTESRSRADAACEAAAEKAYAEGLARGREEGVRDGREQGLAKGKEEFAARAVALAELGERIARELAAAREELLHRGRCELVGFALELAEKIVGRVAVADLAAARENLRKALELAGGAHDVFVRVNPAELAGLQECLPGLVEGIGRTGEISLVADEAISPGGVRLFGAAGEIDATIETQLANVVEALLGPREPRRPDDTPGPHGPPQHRDAQAPIGRYEPAGPIAAEAAEWAGAGRQTPPTGET
jgi:flagellar assembly protein FliH